MNNQRGWSSDPADSLLHRVVNWMKDYERQSQGGIPSNRMIAEGIGLPVDEVISTTEVIIARGLADALATLGGPATSSVSLTPEGQAAASTWTAAWSLARQRRKACRDAVLDWLEEQSERVPDASPFLNDPRAYYFGQPFTREDVKQAMCFLLGQGLIEGVSVAETDDVYQAQITDDGRVCVEQYGGSVSDWMNRGAHRGGDTINITNSPGAQSMNKSPDAQQFASVAITTDARTQLVQIADQILTALKTADLPVEQQQEAAAATAQLRKLTADPAADKGRVRSALGTIATAALSAMGTEAGQRILQLVQQGMRALGA